MFAQIIAHLRSRWHPLWRLRQHAAFRHFQRRWDFPVHTRIPGTDLRVAVRFLRDASWIFSPTTLEPEIRSAFTLVLDLLNPTTFWDIGANIGFYSWFVRRFPSVKHVVMFEPDPTNFNLLMRTIRKNAIQDCQVLNAAVSDSSGKAPFLIDSASGATGSLEVISHRANTHSLHHAYQMNETISCRTVTIDGLIADGLPVPDFIKIDVEGAEHLVLAGARRCLSQYRPTMIIETCNTDLVRHLISTDYVVFQVDDGNFLFVASANQSALSSIKRVFPEFNYS